MIGAGLRLAKKIEKDRTYKVGPYNVQVNFDYSDVISRYDDWKQRCKDLMGKDIGITREETSLYDSLLKHTTANRIVYDKDGPKESEKKKSGQGGAHLLPACETIFSGEMGPQSKELLEAVKRVMDDEGADGHPANPRNMNWQSDIKGWNPKPILDKDGKPKLDANGNPKHKARKGTVYGHYRTETYVNYRREVKKLSDEMEPVSERWYSDQPDTAEPPMWQALYGPGEDLFQDSDSLRMIVEDALEVKGTMDVSKDTPIAIKGLGAAQAIFNEIEPVRLWFSKAVGDSTWRTPAGNFAASRARKWFLNNPTQMADDGDGELMLRIMETLNADYPIKPNSLYLAISENQIRQIATLAGFRRTEERETTAQTQGMVQEDPDVTKKMDWRMVLAR